MSLKHFIIALLTILLSCSTKSTTESVDSTAVDSTVAIQPPPPKAERPWPYAGNENRGIDSRLFDFLIRVNSSRLSVFLLDSGLLYSQTYPIGMMNFPRYSKAPEEILNIEIKDPDGAILTSWFDLFQQNVTGIPIDFSTAATPYVCESLPGYTLTEHNGDPILSQSYESFLAMAGQDEETLVILENIKTLDPLVTHVLIANFTVGYQPHRLLFYLNDSDGQFYVVGMFEYKCERTEEEE